MLSKTLVHAAALAAAALAGSALAGPLDVQITELMGRSPGVDTEYVELFNAGIDPVDIGGWSLEVWDSDAGVQFGTAEPGSPFVVPPGTIIPPGGRFLFANAATQTRFGLTADFLLPGPEVFENGSFTVVLATNEGGAVDTVFFTDGGPNDRPNRAAANVPILSTSIAVGPTAAGLVPAGFLTLSTNRDRFVFLDDAQVPPGASPRATNAIADDGTFPSVRQFDLTDLNLILQPCDASGAPQANWNIQFQQLDITLGPIIFRPGQPGPWNPGPYVPKDGLPGGIFDENTEYGGVSVSCEGSTDVSIDNGVLLRGAPAVTTGEATITGFVRASFRAQQIENASIEASIMEADAEADLVIWRLIVRGPGLPIPIPADVTVSRVNSQPATLSVVDASDYTLFYNAPLQGPSLRLQLGPEFNNQVLFACVTGVMSGSFVSENTCVADFNGDGQVSSNDLASLLGAWGPCK